MLPFSSHVMVGTGFPVALHSSETWLPYATLFSLGTCRIRAGAENQNVNLHVNIIIGPFSDLTPSEIFGVSEPRFYIKLLGKSFQRRTLNLNGGGFWKCRTKAIPGHTAILAGVLLLDVVDLQGTIVENSHTVTDLQETEEFVGISVRSEWLLL